MTLPLEYIVYSAMGGVGLAIIFFLYLLRLKYQQTERKVVDNARLMIERMQEMEHKLRNKEGMSMDEDIKKLYKALVKKLDEAKTEIIEQIEAVQDTLLENEQSKDDEDGSEDDDLEIDSNDDEDDLDEEYSGPRKVKNKLKVPEPPKKRGRPKGKTGLFTKKEKDDEEEDAFG